MTDQSITPMSPAAFTQSMRRVQAMPGTQKIEKRDIGVALMAKALLSNGFAEGLEVFLAMTEGM